MPGYHAVNLKIEKQQDSPAETSGEIPESVKWQLQLPLKLELDCKAYSLQPKFAT